MAGVRIVVRTDIDWAAMRPEAFVNQSGAARPLGFIRFAVQRNVLERWRDAFGTEYFAFRAALQRVARSNLTAAAGAEVSYGFSDFESWYERPRDELIFPIDDDDIFDPALAELAELAEDDASVVQWRHYQYDAGSSGRPVIRPLPFLVLLSNNWGVRKSFLKKHFKPADAQRFLADHKYATLELARIVGISPPEPPNAWFAFNLTSPSVLVTPRPHGLSVKHVGSLTVLRQLLSEDQPIDALRRNVPRGAVEIPAMLGWSRPWVLEYESVFRSLLDGVLPS